MSFLQMIASVVAPVYPFAKRMLYRFHGGVFPRYHKSMSSRNPIREALIPKELILPLTQQIGETAEPLVQVGDQVQKNQLLAESQADPAKKLVVPIHAPTSGTIIAIEPRTLPHASGLKELCIILQPDHQHREIDNVLQSDGSWPKQPQPLKELLAKSGIIGMGGAGFPTYAKLPTDQGRIHTLVINGAECEPFISCDDLLMQTHAEEILLGAQISAQALGSTQILCGIESNKPQAIQAMQKAANKLQNTLHSPVPMEFQEVSTVYPMGGQKQLVLEMTGIELESGGHAIDQGLLMMNVATLRALYRAVEFGDPLTSRLVTVSGLGLDKGFNIEALIGTPFDELAELAEPKSPIDYPLIMGGPMMGIQMPANHVPVLKTTNCILANPPEPRQMQMPCIRCGECMDACPVNLLPQQMYWHAQGHEFDEVEKLNIFDCIECGCCSYVCPSHIPLVQYYRHAKSEIKNLHAEQEATELAKQRHEFKLARIEREKAEREARLKAKKEAVKKQAASASTSTASKTASKPSTKSASSAAAARAAAAKAAAAKKASSSVATSDPQKPLSAREKAIQAAQKAAANKQGQTDKNKKTKGQSLGSAKDKQAATAAAKKRAAMAAAKAKAAAKKQAQQTADESGKSSEQSKDLTTDNGDTSPALQKEQARRVAMEKARQAAKKRKNAEKTSQESTAESIATTPEAEKKSAAKKAAMAAAKRAAAKRAAQKQTKEENDE